MKECPRCGWRTPDEGAKVCIYCGIELVEKDALPNEANDGLSKGISGDVLAVRSNVAGGDIVHGNQVRIERVSVHLELGNNREVIGSKGGKYYLVYDDAKGRTRYLRLKDKMYIHREEGSWKIVGKDGARKIDLGIEDASVSRRGHAIVYVKGGDVYLEDLSSTNGTYVNGRLVRGAVKLLPGDIIRVGANTKFRLERDRNRLSVRGPLPTPITANEAEEFPTELVIKGERDYYLDPQSLGDGTYKIGSRIVDVDKRERSKIIHLAKEILRSDFPPELVPEIIGRVMEVLSEDNLIQIERLIDEYLHASEDDRVSVREKMIKMLEGIE